MERGDDGKSVRRDVVKMGDRNTERRKVREPGRRKVGETERRGGAELGR